MLRAGIITSSTELREVGRVVGAFEAEAHLDKLRKLFTTAPRSEPSGPTACPNTHGR